MQEKKVDVAWPSESGLQAMVEKLKTSYEKKGYTFLRYEEKTPRQGAAYFALPAGGEPRWYDHDSLAVILTLLILPVGLYALWKNKGLSRMAKTFAGVAGFVVLVASIGSFEAPSGDAMKLEGIAGQIKDIDSDITDVQEYPQANGKPLLLVFHSKKSVWSGASWVQDAGIFSQKLLHEVSTDHPGSYSKVQIKFSIPVTDQYGNSGTDVGMSLEYDMGEMQKVNWDNATHWILLNLATPDFKRLGRESAHEFCDEKSNEQYANVFCGLSRLM